MKSEPKPPDAVGVARRAAIMKYQFVYVASTPPLHLMTDTLQRWSPAEREQFAGKLEALRQRMVNELHAIGLWNDTSPSEREIFVRPASAISDQQRINTSWRAEAVHCLAWALGMVDEIPHYDLRTDPKIVVPLIPTADLAEYCKSATLRDSSEIEQAREIAELWNWRSRTRQLQERGYRAPAGQPSLEDIVREVATRMAEDGMLPGVIGGDFPVLGRAYRNLSEDEWANATSIAMERHFALNWLCGYAPGNDWDRTPTGT